ncbi:thioredoxin [Arachnia propionica]|uniref:Thioredoxin n=1 Tax=Arachnia propionica TaxID=1750 RepID=A0A3P1T5D0_9ACTN|nr:thioredoxin [Arachnia propionica]RRD04712.1 thioredoxin [Arachnia propionica]
MSVADITEAQFADEVLLSPVPVVVDYWADWCSPCKQLSPIIDELAREYEGRVKFVKVDTSAEAGLAAQQGILSLPTLQFYKAGRVEKSLSGGKSKNALKKVLDELI